MNRESLIVHPRILNLESRFTAHRFGDSISRGFTISDSGFSSAVLRYASEMSDLDVIRRVLLAILLIGLAGTATELLLLKHDEEPAQFIPLVADRRRVCGDCVARGRRTPRESAFRSGDDGAVRRWRVCSACICITGRTSHFSVEVDPARCRPRSSRSRR